MELQENVAAYINCIQSPPDEDGRHYIKFESGSVCFSDEILYVLYMHHGVDAVNKEMSKQLEMGPDCLFKKST